MHGVTDEGLRLLGLRSDQLWNQVDQLPDWLREYLQDRIWGPRWSLLWDPLLTQLQEDWTDGN